MLGSQMLCRVGVLIRCDVIEDEVLSLEDCPFWLDQR
jgi:hypothetical protein